MSQNALNVHANIPYIVQNRVDGFRRFIMLAGLKNKKSKIKGYHHHHHHNDVEMERRVTPPPLQRKNLNAPCDLQYPTEEDGIIVAGQAEIRRGVSCRIKKKKKSVVNILQKNYTVDFIKKNTVENLLQHERNKILNILITEYYN